VILSKNKKEPTKQLKYSQIIGSHIYLASTKRPGISFDVSKLSRLMSNPGIDHWHALKMAMLYLCGTMSYGIHNSGHPAMLEGYSDANWISGVDDIKATNAYVFTFGGGAVIRPKRIYFSEHFCYCFSSNLCVLNTTNMD
jgi:hypothetical protein